MTLPISTFSARALCAVTLLVAVPSWAMGPDGQHAAPADAVPVDTAPADAASTNMTPTDTAPTNTTQESEPPKAALDVELSGTEPGEGTVRVNLYASEESFLEQEDAQAAVDVPADGAPVVIFEDLAPGTYAVVAYYDVNQNGKLDRGLFGVPLEPIGFSNGAVPVLSAPDFEETAVTVEEGASQAISIALKKLAPTRRADS